MEASSERPIPPAALRGPGDHRLHIRYATREQADAAQAWLAGETSDRVEGTFNEQQEKTK
jgi:hypothetical protein